MTFINVAFIHVTSHAQQQNAPASPHPVLAFLVPVLLNFLQLQYQGKDTVSPFQMHPVATWVAISSLLLYCLAHEVVTRFTQFVRGGVVMGLFGSLLAVSLVSLLLHDSVWLLLFFFYILFLNRKTMCDWLRQRMTTNTLPHEPPQYWQERWSLPV
ncbi:hypothetical protein Vadar_002037 [Vaccinium darrowii]|uniref:Uncharacterized protein n=1 Tax=Vaccinium darrowii TaxID=229202 RepID=A0ACB7Z924_9ERIC|nr:hypothetical protein Vadar_002037 [Vaccinium darrowii]